MVIEVTEEFSERIKNSQESVYLPVVDAETGKKH